MALTIPLRTVDGGSAGSVNLDEGVFGIEPNIPVMHQVVTAQLAAARSGTQSTKTRAEVSGGGKKPFKQKGTGRARQGSTRAPHWVGGGVALGPKPRSYKQRTPKKMVQLALRSALSDRASAERVAVVDEWPWTAPKTADAKAALLALGLEGKILIVLDREKDHDTYRSFRNLPHVQLLLSGELNAYDVLCNDWVVFARYNLPGTGTEVVDSERVAGPTPAPKPKPKPKPKPEPEAPVVSEADPVVNEADPVEGAPEIPAEEAEDTTYAEATGADDAEATGADDAEAAGSDDADETETEETPS
jgi:large subunit ribosomal protein L4